MGHYVKYEILIDEENKYNDEEFKTLKGHIIDFLVKEDWDDVKGEGDYICFEGYHSYSFDIEQHFKEKFQHKGDFEIRVYFQEREPDQTFYMGGEE